MPVFNNILAGSSGQPTGYDIDQSLRFNRSDGGFLERTPLVEGNRRTITISVWCKISELGITNRYIFDTLDASSYSGLYFVTSDKLQFFYYILAGGGSYVMDLRPSMLFRDPSAWYHIVCTMDTTQATESNRAKMYVNGEQITDFHTETYPTENLDTGFNVTYPHNVGTSVEGGARTIGGYLAEFHYIDGTALTPASFGETDATTNQWKPIEVTGLTYGTNGFYQSYSSTELANSFTDSSSSAHTITAVGDVANTRAQYKIGDSSIKFDGTGDKLTVPDSPDWAFGTSAFTIECWINFTAIPSITRLFHWHQDGSNRGGFQVGSSTGLQWFAESGGSSVIDFDQGSNTISLNTWTHIAIVRNSDTFTIYKDGVSVATTTDSDSMPDYTCVMEIGAGSSGDYLTGYMDEIRISDSARYTTTFTPSTTAFTADSNTMLLIQPDFDGGLGADSSGNKNDFAVTNLVATDQMIDTPTNNYCTLNPLINSVHAPTVSDGNLYHAGTVSVYTSSLGTIGFSSGKWYIETYINASTSGNTYLGLVRSSDAKLQDTPFNGESVAYKSNGSINKNDVAQVEGSTTYTTGDIVSMLLNFDDDEINFWVNGSAVPYTVTSFVTGDDWLAGVETYTNGQNVTFNFGQDSSFNGAKTAQGNGGTGEDFYYTPPAGFKALNTDNMSDPEIALPTDHFDTTLYTGDGNSTQSISTNGNFDPEFAWVKIRSGSWGADNHVLYDIVRGDGKRLQSNTTSAEADLTSYGNQVAFATGGITVGSTNSGYNGQVNENANLYVNWNWKAGGTAVSNTDGSITSSVSANPTAGFSIVSYTGTGATATVGHSLSQTPELIIFKNRPDVDDWSVYSETVGNTAGMFLNATNAPDTDSGYYNNTSPTSSVFTVGSQNRTNGSSNAMIAYAFHSIEGYSKVGSYSGNGSTDGSFIYTGMAPSYILVKRTDTADNWAIYDSARDTYNVRAKYLYADDSQAEATYSTAVVDFLSNGFKWRGAVNFGNNSSGSYIYLAFAESPFKTSNAR